MPLLIMLLIIGVFSPGLAAGAEATLDKVLILQDENFFLQDEIRKLQAELVSKDNALKDLLIDKERVRGHFDVLLREKDALEIKVDALQKMVLARDDEFPVKVEQAASSYRFRMEAAVNELKAMTMAMEEKKTHLDQVVEKQALLEKKVDLLTGEKMSLLASLRKISAELDDLKAEMNGQIADMRTETETKVKDFQVRLAAEQRLVQEKIAQAKKPLEDKLMLMEVQYKNKEAALRQNAAAEIKKATAASAAQLKDLQRQLDVCRQAPSSK